MATKRAQRSKRKSKKAALKPVKSLTVAVKRDWLE